MNKRLLTILSIAAITASSAVMAEEGSKYYVGLDVAVAGTSGTVTFDNGTTQTLTVNTPLKLTGGYNLRPGFAIEASYINVTGKKTFTSGETIKQSVDFLPVVAVWSRDFAPTVSGSLKAGLGYFSGKIDISPSFTDSTSGIKATFGASASYRFTPAISAVVGLDWIPDYQITSSGGGKSVLTSRNAYLGARYAF